VPQVHIGECGGDDNSENHEYRRDDDPGMAMLVILWYANAAHETSVGRLDATLLVEPYSRTNNVWWPFTMVVNRSTDEFCRRVYEFTIGLTGYRRTVCFFLRHVINRPIIKYSR
jgi:hypothetical protein